MNKVAHYLQEHLTGEVVTGNDAKRYFSTDTSIFSLPPAIVVYPRNENDVRKAARFTWQLAERGRVIPITARGAGTDQGGAALGPGIVMVFPAHMHRILEMDSKAGHVLIEAGINYGKLQQTLHTHNRFLPAYPASLEYSTIGGAIANNASGERSLKYGDTRSMVKGLRVVLANGEVIETHRLSKRELNKKLGLATLEGEIYRNLDALIEENSDLIKKYPLKVTKNAAGYALHEVKRKDGSMDLTPLIVGSQGTLGIVTEATLQTQPHNPHTILIVGLFDDLKSLQEVVTDLRKMKNLPSAIEVVDGNLLEYIHNYNPNYLKGVIDPPFPKFTLFVEFDDTSDRLQKKLAKRVAKILGKHKVMSRVETDPLKKEELWKVRHGTAAIVGNSDSDAKAVPIIEDGIVPPEKLGAFITGIYALYERHGMRAAIWGHAGDGHIRTMPMLNLSQLGDRQKMVKIMDEYYRMIAELGGSSTAGHGDGRLRGPYLQTVFGAEWYELFKKVKKIFDPFGILNPGVKLDVSNEQLKTLMRQEYSLEHLHDHLVRS